MKDEPKRRFDLGWVVLLGSLSLAVYPLLQPGLPSVADAAIHLFRTAEWVRCWQDGVLYPRWSPNLAFGYGFPLFVFAPPLPYLLAGVLHLLGGSLELGIKALPLIGFVLMGLGMYLLVRDVLGTGSALLAAVAFVYAPFQLREAYIYGGNYPQFLAIALFPWVLWTFRRAVLTRHANYLCAAGVTYGALALSHNFHAFIFTPILALYLLGLVWVERRWASVIWAIGAGVLGLALSACFWLPALYERQWSLAHEGFYVVRSNFELRFLSLRELLAGPQALDSRAANPYMPFALGWGACVLALLGILALVLNRRLSRQQRFHLIFFTGLLALALFMVLPVSAEVWQSVPLLATAEFPWRLMGVATLALSFLVGGSWWLTSPPAPPRFGEGGFGKSNVTASHQVGSSHTLNPPRNGEEWSWRTTLLAAAMLLLILMSMVYTYPPRPFTCYGTPSLAESVRYELSTQTIGTTTLGEYLPIWVKERPLTSPMAEDYLASRPIDKLDRTGLPAGASARLVERTAASDVYAVSSPAPWTFRLHTFYYPGWVASVDGQPAKIQIESPRGLINVPVPAGEHTVAIRFKNIPMRTVANVVSGLALAVILGAVAYSLTRARKVEGDAQSLPPGHEDTKTVTREEHPSGCSFGRQEALPLVIVFLLALALRAGVIDPYTDWFRIHSPQGQVLGAEHPARINFGNKVALLGYDLQGEPTVQGGSFHLRLYWQALGPLGADYSSFVHLDEPPNWVTRAQSDNVHPGDARAQIDVPARNWTPDTYVRDEHTVAVPAGVAPLAYALRVGLYGRDGRRLPVLDENGRTVGDAAFLQPFHVLPVRPVDLKVTNWKTYRLGDKIELLGIEPDTWVLHGKDTLRLCLFWRASAVPDLDYTVFVHVLDSGGKPVAQSDSQPVKGAYPSRWWWPGQIIEDIHEVPLPGIGPGSYRVAVGMYDLGTGARLPVRAESSSPLPDGQIVLEQEVKIEP